MVSQLLLLWWVLNVDDRYLAGLPGAEGLLNLRENLVLSPEKPSEEIRDFYLLLVSKILRLIINYTEK